MQKELLGWWLFDADRAEITHADTGQSLRFAGIVDNNAKGFTTSVNRKWMQFKYKDGEELYPLLVEWRNVPSELGGRPLVWRVDYARSMALWNQLPHPSYHSWRRIDDFLIDALACWPSHPNTGAYPAYIAFNGGWLNGGWTNSLYRTVFHSNPQLLGVKPLPEQATGPAKAASPWLLMQPLVDLPKPLLKFRQILQADDWNEVWKALQISHFLATEDYSRVLVALLSDVDTKINLKSKNRFFYADPEIITDTICVSIRDVGGQPISWTITFDRKTPIGLLHTKTSNQLSEHKIVHDFGSIKTEVDYVPNVINLRLTYACLDAWLAYPNLSWTRLISEPEKEAISLPEKVYIHAGRLAGTTMPFYMEASWSLSKSSAQPNSLAYMFDEENDGVLRQLESSKTFGFWIFNPASQSLLNSLSSQKVKLLGLANKNDLKLPDAYQVWRFEYEDADITYSLIVWSLVTASDGRLQYTWILDHDKSALLYQHDTGCSTKPPYGLWQRVNECVVDALLCWPELEITGPKPYSVVSSSGWYNGTWSHLIRRSRNRGSDFAIMQDSEIQPPSVQALGAHAFSWSFTDAPSVAGSAKLANVQEIESGHFYLPADAALTGFENNMPYLKRSDDNAVMFPAGLKSHLHRGEDYSPGTFFLYADDEVFFHFDGREFSGWRGLPSSWDLKISSMRSVGLRSEKALTSFEATNLFLQQKSKFGFISTVPSPALSQRINTAILDGWLAWTGSSKRLLDDPVHLKELEERAQIPSWERSGIDLGQKSKVRVEGCYIGGLYNSTATSTSWFEKSDPVT